MPLTPGSRLGPYEILAVIGAGGMGEVYRARDPRLKREVALKILPETTVSLEKERLQRFEKEAQSTSSLNHPNIVTIYEVGTAQGVSYIAMELVDGKTLREMLRTGALPLRRLLSLAAQIADGLAKAHEAGIVHRDLKPENIMVTKDGFVKILDFGLAKLTQPGESREAGSAIATVTQATQPGTILGTVSYMSPEQASGQPLDFRTDQFSLGAILYELVTGRRPFEGKTVPETLAAIIRQEPEPIGELAPATPTPLRWIVERCLSKEPGERYGSTRDLARDLSYLRDHVSEISSDASAGPVLKRSWRRRRELAAWTAASLFAVVAALLLLRRPDAAPTSPIYAQLLPPAGTEFAWDWAPLAVSPDGQRIVFGARPPGGDETDGFLCLRVLAEAEAQKLPGTEHATYPFWSPDSRAVGFFTQPDGKLKRIGITGASPQVICDVLEPRGGTWGADDVILFGTLNGPLFRVSAAGGQPVAATHLDSTRREADHRWPHFLPDGRHFLFLALTGENSSSLALNAGSFDAPNAKFLARVESSVAYAPPGYLLSATADRTLIAQPFDADGLRLLGGGSPIAEHVLVYPLRRTAVFSVSRTGLLAYQAAVHAEPGKLGWFDRSGKQLESFGTAREYGVFSLSPDGTRLVTEVTDPRVSTTDLWVHDLARGTTTRLTFDPADEGDPVWSPDGRQVAFYSSRKGSARSLYLKPAGGAGAETLLLESESEITPTDWSPDGRFLACSRRQPGGKFDLWALPMTGERKPFAITQTPFDYGMAQFSPDGRLISYASDESGRYEVYVQAFPKAVERWQLSSAGGGNPRWRRDGRELFYQSLDGQLMSVGVQTQPAFVAGTPRPLFRLDRKSPYYAVAPDGRFLFMVPESETRRPPISLVFNWLSKGKTRDRERAGASGLPAVIRAIAGTPVLGRLRALLPLPVTGEGPGEVALSLCRPAGGDKQDWVARPRHRTADGAPTLSPSSYAIIAITAKGGARWHSSSFESWRKSWFGNSEFEPPGEDGPRKRNTVRSSVRR
jgi:dipeptidyl aminopeptidase/acylaminoacyl peptidase